MYWYSSIRKSGSISYMAWLPQLELASSYGDQIVIICCCKSWLLSIELLKIVDTRHQVLGKSPGHRYFAGANNPPQNLLPVNSIESPTTCLFPPFFQPIAKRSSNVNLGRTWRESCHTWQKRCQHLQVLLERWYGQMNTCATVWHMTYGMKSASILWVKYRGSVS